jgi:hypothetical protein
MLDMLSGWLRWQWICLLFGFLAGYLFMICGWVLMLAGSAGWLLFLCWQALPALLAANAGCAVNVDWLGGLPIIAGYAG